MIHLKCPVCRKGHYNLNSAAACRCETVVALRLRRAVRAAASIDDQELVAAKTHAKHWRTYCAALQQQKRR